MWNGRDKQVDNVGVRPLSIINRHWSTIAHPNWCHARDLGPIRIILHLAHNFHSYKISVWQSPQNTTPPYPIWWRQSPLYSLIWIELSTVYYQHRIIYSRVTTILSHWLWIRTLSCLHMSLDAFDMSSHIISDDFEYLILNQMRGFKKKIIF